MERVTPVRRTSPRRGSCTSSRKSDTSSSSINCWRRWCRCPPSWVMRRGYMITAGAFGKGRLAFSGAPPGRLVVLLRARAGRLAGRLRHDRSPRAPGGQGGRGRGGAAGRLAGGGAQVGTVAAGGLRRPLPGGDGVEPGRGRAGGAGDERPRLR